MAASRKRQVAPERLLPARSTFSKSVTVSMGVSTLEQTTWYSSMLEWRSMARTTMRCLWLKSYCCCHAWDLWRVLFSQQGNASVHLAREPTNILERDRFISVPKSTYLKPWNPVGHKNLGRNAAVGLRNEFINVMSMNWSSEDGFELSSNMRHRRRSW